MLGPMFPYYGAKWRLSKTYGVPVYPTIVEPFAGSACYSCQYASRNVRLYDKDPVIVGVWDYLIKASRSDILSLPTEIQTVSELPICQEARWLIGFWANPASIAPRNVGTAWSRIRWRNIRERLARQIEEIRHWTVTCSSYEEIPVNREATWFVDPPYQEKGKHYVCGSSQIDYQHLGSWCKSLPGQVIVCENEGADWLPFQLHHLTIGAVAKNGAAKNRSREVVWYKDHPQMALFEQA